MSFQLLDDIINAKNDRRGFLKGSFLGLFILNTASLFISSCSSYPDSKNQLKVFNNKEDTILTNIAEAFVASEETGLPSPSEINLVKDIDAYISTVSDESQKQYKLLLNVFDDYTFVFSGSLKKFTQMNYQEKANYLDLWAKSNVEFRQMAYRALKMSIMMIYYTKDETWEKIGYTGAVCLGGTNK